MSTILIVEDDPDLRRSVRAVLSAARFEVIEADGVETGLARVHDSEPDLVICDLHLGRRLGLDILNELRRTPATASLPLIFITGSGDESARRQSMDLGADDFLNKPFSAQELTAAVKARLKKQRQADRALRDSEARHRLLFENAPDAITISGPPAWNFVEANAATLRMFGARTKGEFLSKGPADVSPERQPDHTPSSEKAKVMIETALREGYHAFEWSHKRLTGEVFPATVLLTRMRVGDQTLLQARIRDLSESRRAEAALRESESRFRALFQTMNEGVALHEIIYAKDGRPVDYRILDVNPGYERHTGIPAERARGQLAREVYGTTTAPFLDVFGAVAQTGKSATFDTYFAPLRKHFQISICPPKQGQFATIITDITERKQIEQDLVERSRLAGFGAEIGKALTKNRPFNTILQECTELMVQHLDAAFARIWILNAATNTLELRASAGLYTHLDGPHSRVPVGNLKIGLIAKEKLPHLTNDVLSDPRVGDKEWARREAMVAFAGHPLLVGDEIVGVMALFARRPLEECVIQRLASVAESIAVSAYRHQAEERRKSMEVQLRHAQKLESIGQLAAGIAHEINSPMQYLGDNTSFLQTAFGELRLVVGAYRELTERLRLQPALAEALGPVETLVQAADLAYLLEEIPSALDQSLQGVERVVKIVNAMKEFSHPGVEEKTIVDLNHAIESTVTVARNEWKYVADMELKLDPLLPSVPCLPGEFNQVILNLIVNAAHAIADVVGGQPVQKGKITITTRPEAQWVEVRITDTGTGIPEGVRERVFDPFFTTKPVGKGSGQGLAIARSVIVDKHSGTLAFETELGHGTTFVIRLPAVPPEVLSPLPQT